MRLLLCREDAVGDARVTVMPAADAVRSALPNPATPSGKNITQHGQDNKGAQHRRGCVATNA